MKILKILLLLLFTAVLVYISGCESNDNPTSSAYIPQPVNRKVLVEFFSNSDCGPCINAHRYFIEPLTEQAGVTLNDSCVILVSFQVNFPNSSDSLYWANRPENQARANYYNHPAAPAGFLDGSEMGAFSTSEWPPEVNAELMSTRYMVINLSNTYDSVSRSGSVTANINTQTAVPTTDNVIHVVLVENKVPYISAQNGITQYEYVMRDMVNDSTGAPVTLTQGQTTTVDQSYTVDNRWKQDDCYLTVFVQSASSKKVYGVERIKIIN
jgi:thiol-disulfide isomerase/thioredoxin